MDGDSGRAGTAEGRFLETVDKIAGVQLDPVRHLMGVRAVMTIVQGLGLADRFAELKRLGPG